MSANVNTAPAPTRATHKGHDYPAQILYFGCDSQPEVKGVRASVTVGRSEIAIFDSKGVRVGCFGTATKFWAAPVAVKTPAVKAVKATPAPAAEVAATPAGKAAATRAESAASDETQVCVVCGEDKPIRKFPTTTRDAAGVLRRGRTCRACRDA